MNRPDRRDYIGAAQKIVRYGLANFYDPTTGDRANREAPVPYPPIPVYFYAAAGYIYQTAFDRSFSEIPRWRDVPSDSLILNYLVEVPVFLFEMLLAVLIFWFIRRRLGERQAILCAGLYALNPAILLDGALWAQPDAIHCGFLVLAVIGLLERRPFLCLLPLPLTLLSKPQPAVIVPVILLLAILNFPRRQMIHAALAALAVALIVLLPFLVQNPRAVWHMVQIIAHAHPYVSLNAHNLWWLVTSFQGVDARWLPDHSNLVPHLTYFAAAMLVFTCLYFAVIIKTSRAEMRLGAEPFAFLALLWFVVAVRMHENHLVQVLPLLLLTGLTLRHQKVVFAVLTLTVFANMLLHSHEVVGDSASRLIHHLRMANAALNVAALGYWGRHFFSIAVAPLPQIYRRLPSRFIAWMGFQ